MRLVVRDAVSGAPIAGLPIRFHFKASLEFELGEGHSPAFITGSDGAVVASLDDAVGVSIDLGTWSVPPGTTIDSLRADGTLWLYAEHPVEAIVTFVGLNPSEDPPPIIFKVYPDVVNTGHLPFGWFTRSRLTPIIPRRTNLGSGRFRLVFPTLRGLVMSASSPGWVPDIEPDPGHTADGQSCPVVQFNLERAFRHAGRLVNEHGEPVPNKRFSFIVLQRRKFDRSWNQMVDAERVQGEGISAAGYPAKDLVTVQSRHSVVTNDHGDFEISVSKRGEAYLCMWEPGYLFRLEPIGDSGESRDDLEFRVSTTETRKRLRVKKGGVPIKNSGLLLMNYTYWPLEVSYTLWTDANGDLEVGNLTQGDWFGVQIRGLAEEARVFRLDSQAEIDLTELGGAVEYMNRK